MRAKLFVTWVVLGLTLHALGQDYTYTQYDKAMLMLNPSSAGNFDGFERFTSQQRNQWVGAATRFNTSFAAGEFTWKKNGFDNQSYLGMGLHAVRDVGGDARFGNNQVAATLAGHLVVSKKSKVSAGIQTSYTNRSGNFSDLLFYSQWNGSTFDPSIATNEPNQVAKFNFVDAAAGISYTFSSASSRVSKRDQRYLNVGLFAQHIAKPRLRYNDITFDRLQPKWGAHVEGEISLGNSFGLALKSLQMIQGKHYLGRYGAFLKVLFKPSASITRFKNDSYLSVGSYMSSSGTLSPCFLLDMGGLQFGFNYDIELGKISRAYRSSLEFSVSYSFTKKSLFKNSKIK
ncbi:MAG: hypothetical protein RIQ90_899 [Bacteroidota bacterium]|jgi:type IX secretion system PorP/SprF family membrane protein